MVLRAPSARSSATIMLVKMEVFRTQIYQEFTRRGNEAPI